MDGRAAPQPTNIAIVLAFLLLRQSMADHKYTHHEKQRELARQQRGGNGENWAADGNSQSVAAHEQARLRYGDSEVTRDLRNQADHGELKSSLCRR
jgi:hypothetical protein